MILFELCRVAHAGRDRMHWLMLPGCNGVHASRMGQQLKEMLQAVILQFCEKAKAMALKHVLSSVPGFHTCGKLSVLLQAVSSSS